MPNPKPARRKTVKFLDTKALIAASSLAVTLGLWNLFSTEAVRAEQAAQPSETPPPSDEEVYELSYEEDLAEDGQAAARDLPPLPTLVPLVERPDPAVRADAPGASAASAGQPLRSVTAQESQVIVQKFKPVIDMPAPVSSGGSRKSGSRAVTSTRSSR